MPKVEMDYSKTIIYKLVCKDINITDIYIGHTTNFTKRKNQHKSNCNNPNSKNYNLFVYKFIRDNGNFNNWDMIEIEKYNCIDRLEASKRERHWVEELKSTLNKQMPSRTPKEARQYYKEQNKDKLIEKHKEYTQSKRGKEISKQYREKNKNKIQPICICNICNCNYSKNHKARHEKSQNHLNNLLN